MKPNPFRLASLCALVVMASFTAALAQNRSLPPDGGYINVKTDFGAVGNGIADDTAAIQAAIRHVLQDNRRYNPPFIYLPNGTYKISDTLITRMEDQTKFSKGWRSGMVLYGESTDGTMIRLADSAPGFGEGEEKPMLLTGSENPNRPDGTGNQGFKHSVLNLTVHTGKGNPGAVGIDYNVSNIGTIRRVRIVDGDGSGQVGLRLTRNPGPGLVKEVEIEGFGVGIESAGWLYSMVFEDVALRGQRVAGVTNKEQALSFRKLTSENSVPVIQTETDRGLINLVDCDFRGGEASTSAIVNTGKLHIVNLDSTGYGTVIQNSGAKQEDVRGGSGTTKVANYVSHGPYRAFPGSAETTLGLPIEESPDFHTDDFKRWANAAKAASPQAAIDSGKEIVYFPNGLYKLDAPLIIRGNVRKIIGMEATLEPGPGFPGGPLVRFEDGDQPEVILEHLRVKGDVEHASDRTFALRHFHIVGALTNTDQATGKLFLEDFIARKSILSAPLRVWARQLNIEKSPDSVLLTNDGATLWVLGYKTENAKTAIETLSGGKTELLGGLLYLQTKTSPVPAFIVKDSAATLSYAVGSNRFPIQVEEHSGGRTQNLDSTALPPRGNGNTCTLFIGGQTQK